jgi:hypothetical protein
VGDYDGPHKILLNRNELNLGIMHNTHKLFSFYMSIACYVTVGGGLAITLNVSFL